MTKARSSLRLLTRALRGRPPADSQWIGVIELANQAWLGPALHLALADTEISFDVRDYLSFLHERNLERNRRLRAQLVEAACALNADHVEPVLLKGAIRLVAPDSARLGARIMSDLDISIESSDMARARAALTALGYREVDGLRGMGRANDPGLIELRDGPSPRARAYLRSDLTSNAVRVEVEGAIVRVPTPTAQALHLVVHDMLKEGDYWRCRLDLRHLHDLAELATCGAGVDWNDLATRLADRPARRALALQLRALQDLFAVPVPRDLVGGPQAHVVHKARMLAAGRKTIGAPARLAGNIVWGVHRLTTAHAYRWRGSRDFMERAYRVLAEEPKGSRL